MQVPEAPLLSVTSTTTSSIRLSWNKVMSKNPVVSFDIFYRQMTGGVQQKVVDGNEDVTFLEDLLCGTLYELQIQARNQVGAGPKSPVVRAMTRGSGPMTPDVDTLTSFIQSMPSSLILHLDHWPSGGCHINYIQIEKKGPLGIGADHSWNVLSTNVNPDEQPMFKIHDFVLDNIYHLKLTAFSDAGSQSVSYSIRRLSHKHGNCFGPIFFKYSNQKYY